MKLLHISFSMDYHYDILFICNKIKIKPSFMLFDDGTKGKYNIGKDRANNFYNKNKEYFNLFDIILISDIAPISRVFLQNNWNKKLLIWIHNRFDYCDMATNDCMFPDEDYYKLFKESTNKKNVKIFSHTFFENFYCNNIRNINIGNLVINNIGINPNYHNENNLNIIWNSPNNSILKLSDKLKELKINYTKKKFIEKNKYKSVIHIPDNWTNYYLFESLHMGIAYFIPTKDFLIKIIENTDFYWCPPFSVENIHMSEWYNNKEWFIYFNSWNDLVEKIKNTDYEKQRNFLIQEGEKHKNNIQKLWESILL